MALKKTKAAVEAADRDAGLAVAQRHVGAAENSSVHVEDRKTNADEGFGPHAQRVVLTCGAEGTDRARLQRLDCGDFTSVAMVKASEGKA